MWLANGIPEEIWMHLLASRLGNELYSRPMAFLRKLATCAREWLRAVWLASGIPEEIGYLHWKVELGMSYVASQGK